MESGGAGYLVAPACVVTHRIDNRGHVLPSHSRQRLSGVQALQFDEFVLMLFDERRGPLQYAAALGGPHPAPDPERCACRADREIHIGFAAFCHLGNRLFGGWIQIDGIPAVDGCRRQAIDE
jgi:hypothetical protein